MQVYCDGVRYYSEDELKAVERRVDAAQTRFEDRIAEYDLKERRCADMVETLVTALAQHEGHDELIKDARVYLNILINGQEEVKPFENYFAWRDRQGGE